MKELALFNISKTLLCYVVAGLLGLCVVTAHAQTAAAPAKPLRLLAAGSLRGAMNVVIGEWQRLHPDQPVEQVNGPAGWLRERIEQGEAFDVYASAALSHAQALHEEGWTGPAALMLRNRLCASVKADSTLTTDTVVKFLLLPSTRIATSTPKLDPGGDYTWEFFRRLDDAQPGAFASLTARSQQIYGGAPSTAKPAQPLSDLINQNIFDVAIGYCSGKADSGPTALKRVALPVPAPLADYGLAVSKKAGATASEFAKFVLSPVAQQVFADYGFIPATR